MGGDSSHNNFLILLYISKKVEAPPFSASLFGDKLKLISLLVVLHMYPVWKRSDPLLCACGPQKAERFKAQSKLVPRFFLHNFSLEEKKECKMFPKIT